ncbi:MAG: hypothetical protein ACON4U_13660 [Myxococcota bacterium]
MSHSTPPDDPTEMLKAFFRHIEAHLEENNPLNEADAKEALRKGLEALTRSENHPEMAVLDGGLSSQSHSDLPPKSSKPELAIHSKIESDDHSNREPNNAIPFADFQLNKGAQVSVHIVNADDVSSLFNPKSAERGHILLSNEQPNQTILFGKTTRHVRIFCREGSFEVGTEEGPFSHLTSGQSIDVEGICVYVSSETISEGDYVMLSEDGIEW